MMEKMSIYETILYRRSIRRYQSTPVPDNILESLLNYAQSILPFNGENQFLIFNWNLSKKIDLTQLVGGYGHLISTPHIWVPYLLGKDDKLVDLGYRTQQLVLQMTRLGIGTCYVGLLSTQIDLIKILGLPSEAVLGAAIAFGNPQENILGKSVNDLITGLAGGRKRLDLDKIFFIDDFSQPGLPPDELLPIMEAARWAPSALNAQPWRFLWRENLLHLLVDKKLSTYRLPRNYDYYYYDGGIALANLLLTARELNLEHCLVPVESLKGIDIPDNLIPLAAVKF
jgi:nitroreductase